MTKFTDDPNRPHCRECDYPMKRNKGKTKAGLQRYSCTKCGKSTTGSTESDYQDQSLGYLSIQAKNRAKNLRQAIRKGANRFVVTAAANNCEVNYAAFKSLLNLCEDRGAHLIVVPIHYKNISLFTAGQQYKKWWAKSLRPFLMDERLRIGPKTYVMGDVKVQATAADPLSGMAPLAGPNWAIFGHSQMALEPIATPLNQPPGRMYTTGVITQKSYSRTKMGAKAAFHHVTGAQLVEVSGSKVFIRQLNADSNGVIYDLDDKYTPEGVERNQSVLSLTTGDEHVKWMLPGVRRATYTGADSMTNTLRPEYLIRHDILDGYAGSHHHRKSYLTQYKKYVTGDHDYRAELDQVVDHINQTTPTDWECTNILVEDSNHHGHLDRWLNDTDDRVDHQNADLISELRMAQREAVRDGRRPDAFELYVEPRLKVPARFITPDEPFMLGGVDFSQHGHKGANGARGSARSFANTTHKLTIGHSHSARIVKSVYQVGKSCGVLEYESGLSSHTNTHSIQYQNGKRTLVDVLGHSWRAMNRPNDGGMADIQ